MTNEASPAAPLKAPRWRWWQFSLRTLLLVVVLCMLPAAWFGYELEQCRQEKSAVAWVEEQGGRLDYDWRREKFGAWCPARVRSIDLIGKQVSDVTQLAGLEKLQVLDLSFTQVSDLTPLAGLENLRGLYLLSTQVSDLSPLAGLANLRELDLGHTQVSDLTPLTELENLDELILTKAQVSDEQVQALQEALPNCLIKY